MTRGSEEAIWLLPNLGAEEGTDFAAYPRLPHARIAARLFGLLLPARARLAHPGPDGGWRSERVGDHWPPGLGEPAEDPVEGWLDPSPDALAWLATPALAARLARAGPTGRPMRLAGPDPELLRPLHDKRFAVDTARRLALDPPELSDLIVALEPEELADADALAARLDAALDRWPDWTGRRFTLKPRFGSSGRGRVGGTGRIDLSRLCGALPRLARQGGALFEPWLERTIDLSVALRVPGPAAPPEILASFEMITTASGVYRGHAGEIDATGRIHSGDRDDARARECATALVARAAAAGLTGPCGVDAFRFRLGETGPERLRGAVELNARPTMGLVAWGLVRRALAVVPTTGSPAAPAARAFLFTQLTGDTDARRQAMLEQSGPGALAIELAPRGAADEPRPLLFFGSDRRALREAHRAVEGC